MAFTGASIGIEAIIGLVVGGVLAVRTYIVIVFTLVDFLFMIILILIIFFIKESFVTTDRGKFHLKAFVPIIKHPAILLASLAAFALMVSNGTLAFALPLNVEAMERATDTTGMLLSTFGIVALIVF